MSKRTRRPPGFYASLLNDASNRICSFKYRPKVKPTVMGVYEVERVVAKRIRGGKTELFLQWKNYSPAENIWETAEHVPEELITAFETRSADPLHVHECRERLGYLFEKGLKSPTACTETMTMRHDVLRMIFPGLPSDLRRTPYLVSEEELISAGLGCFLKKCLTVTGGGCRVDTPNTIFKKVVL